MKNVYKYIDWQKKKKKNGYKLSNEIFLCPACVFVV